MTTKSADRHFNGPALLVAMFRELDPVFRTALRAKLQSASPILARFVDEFEFIYRDIPRLDDRSIQLLFTQIPETDWLIAWKLSDDATKAFLLKNMSEGRRKEFVLAAGAQRKMLRRQVIKVQVRIARTIHGLLSQGKLGLRSKRLTKHPAKS